MTQSFPTKSKKDMERIMKTLVASGVVSSIVTTGILNQAHAADLKNDESTYIEKDATATDPSFRHSDIEDIHNLPSYINSSFVDKFNDMSFDKRKNKIYDKLMDESNHDKSYLPMNHRDYLHYISSNGDHLFVHYVDEKGHPLGFNSKDLKDEKSSASTNHSGGFFMYPFMLGGNHYSGASNGVMKSNMKGTTGKGSYSNNPQSKSFKTTTSNVSQGTSKATSRGMGSSMSSGGRGASSAAGG